LIEESKSKPTFKDSRKCSVLTGHWYDGFTGRSVQKASELHIDHLVALKNAHDSGGCLWNSKIKAAYANDMGFEFHLNAMIGRTNTSKGSHGPEKWRPPKRSSWCLYARAWSYVKYRWRLSMTSQERQSLYGMLKYCRQF
jgi:hypothetical protein